MNKILKNIPFKKLTPTEEADLVAAGDLATLVEHTLMQAFNYGNGTHQGRTLDDGLVLAAAYDGLTKAAKNFDPTRLRFLAYAKPYIRGALCKAHRDQYLLSKYEFNLQPESFCAQHPSVDSDVEDEEKTHVPAYTSLPAESITAPSHEIIYIKEEWNRMRPVLAEVLDARERMILELNYQGGLNLREIAALLGVTRSDTHHAKQTALKKVRNRLMDLGKFSRD